MTISPSGSWIWQNGHCSSIRNGPNSREPVWLCRNQVRKWVNRSKNQFWATGGSLGWTGNILWNILSARRGLDAARRMARLGKGIFFGAAGGSARRGLMAWIWRAWKALVFNLWARRLRVVKQCRIFRWRVWATSVSDQADFYGSEFVWMISTRWNDQNLFLTTLKIRLSPKTLLFSDERGSDTNCWWEKPLVVALKHSEGIKHTVLLQEQIAYKHKKLTIHALSLSL